MVNCGYLLTSGEIYQCQHKQVTTKNQLVNEKICNQCKFKQEFVDLEKLRTTLPKITVTGPEIKGPGIVQMAQNFGEAMVTQAKATLEGKETFVPKEIYEERLEICRGCEWFNKGRCLSAGCGCFLGVKAKLATSVCPLHPPKWSEWHASGVTTQ